MCHHGRVAAGLEPGELDLTEVLSAVHALDLLCPVDDDSKGRLAVWLAWRTGLAAMRSLHVEPIVVQWLGDPNRLRSRRWQRLPVVGKELGERMSASEMGVLQSFCRGILGRVAVIDEKDLQEVARALLIATGHLGPRDGSVGMTGALGRVSALGRALTPDRGETTAQTRLLPQQKTLIRTALSRGRTECGLPLLAQLPQLTPEQRKIATQLLAEAL